MGLCRRAYDKARLRGVKPARTSSCLKADPEKLPTPEVIAREILDDRQAALDQRRPIAGNLIRPV